MICDISMAQPRNISVDADHNVKFSFIFYGDGCNGADCFIYDRENPNYEEGGIPHSTYIYDARHYYNEEEIDINTRGSSLDGLFVNNKSYVWKLRLYEDVNISKGKYPSVLREKTAIANPPFLFGTVQEPEEEITDEHIIPIEKGLSVTLPMWMYIGDSTERRVILSYDSETGFVKLKNTFKTYPTSGSSYSLTAVKSVQPKESDLDGKICLPIGISILNRIKYTRGAPDPSGGDTYIWYAEVGGMFRAITNYDYETGLTTLQYNFPDELEVGTKINIWCSFIDSNFFAVDTKPSPYFKNVKAELDGENLHFSAELATNHIVQKYWWDIYEDDVLVETTKEIPMGKLDYYFTNWRQDKIYTGVLHLVTQDGMVNQEDSSWWSSSSGVPTNSVTVSVGIQNTCLSAVCATKMSAMDGIQLTMCDELIYEGTLESSLTQGMSYVNIGVHSEISDKMSKGLCVRIGSEAYSSVKYNANTGVIQFAYPVDKTYPAKTEYKVYTICPQNSSRTYRVMRQSIHGTELVGDFNKPIITDFVCSANTQYNYIVKPFTLSGEKGNKTATLYNECVSNDITLKIREVAIYGLIPLPFSGYTNDDTRIRYSYQKDSVQYAVDEFWGATLDMEPERGVTQNLNRTIYSGDKKKPIAVVGKNDYDSFALTFTLGSVSCAGNRIALGNIEDISRWKKFIGKGELVLIKAPDGEIWAGYLTSHNYTKIYGGGKIQYKVTAEFTELVSIAEVRAAE